MHTKSSFFATIKKEHSIVLNCWSHFNCNHYGNTKKYYLFNFPNSTRETASSKASTYISVISFSRTKFRDEEKLVWKLYATKKKTKNSNKNCENIKFNWRLKFTCSVRKKKNIRKMFTMNTENIWYRNMKNQQSVCESEKKILNSFELTDWEYRCTVKWQIFW